MCEGNESGPLCVEWCLNDVLIYEEREEEVDEEIMVNEMEVGLDALITKYGLDRIETAVSRMTKRN